MPLDIFGAYNPFIFITESKYVTYKLTIMLQIYFLLTLIMLGLLPNERGLGLQGFFFGGGEAFITAFNEVRMLIFQGVNIFH